MRHGLPDPFQRLSDCLADSSGLQDTALLEVLDSLQEAELATSHLARLQRASPATAATAAAAASSERARDAPMKLAPRHLLISVDEHRCTPGEAQVQAGGSVRLAVTSGPPQSFEISTSGGGDADETPRIPAGEHYDWWPPVAGSHTIASQVYPGCKATVVVRPPAPSAAAGALAPPPAAAVVAAAAPAGASSGAGSDDSMWQQVDEGIRFPLGRISRGSQTDAVPSTSRFTSTAAGTTAAAAPGSGAAEAGRLPLLRSFRPQAACSPASVLPGITTAAAAAVAAGNGSRSGSSRLFASPEEEEVSAYAGLRRRSTQRPGSAGSIGSVGGAAAPLAAAAEPARTPDAAALLGGSASTASSAESLPGSASSQGSLAPRPSACAPGPTPIFRNMSALQRPLSPALSAHSVHSAHSAEETMPLLDIRMNNRVQHRPSPVFPGSGARGALVSPTPVASRDATHKCPRCRTEFLSIVNQRRCLAVHLGHKAQGGGCGKGSGGGNKAGAMPDRAQLVEFWDSLPLAEKKAALNLKAEPGSEAVLRNLEVRLLQRDGSGGHTTAGQKQMYAAGKTLFDVAVRGQNLENLSGDALAKLLDKASEGTFLYDRALPARDESYLGYNAEAGLSAFISKRLVDALLHHRQQAAEKAQRELEELEEAHKGEKAKQAEKKKKPQDKKASKPKAKAAAKGGAAGAGAAAAAGGRGRAPPSQSTTLSRSASLASSSEAGASDPNSAEAGRSLGLEDSARVVKPPALPHHHQQQQQGPAGAAGAAQPAGAGAVEATPAKGDAGDGLSSSSSRGGEESDADLTPPPTAARYSPDDGAATRRPAAAGVTYTNALYRAEGKDGSGSWQPAGRNGRTAASGAAAAGRPGQAAGGPSSGGSGAREAPRSNGHLQQLAGGTGSKAGQAGDVLRPGPRPPLSAAAAAIRAAARPCVASGKPPTAASAVPPEEAFPALPSQVAAQKSAPQPAAAPAAASPAAAAGDAATPKAPVPGISYALAAKSVTVKQAQQQAAAQKARQPALAAAKLEPPPAQRQQEQQQATMQAPADDASAKVPPPLPMVPRVKPQAAAAEPAAQEAAAASAVPREPPASAAEPPAAAAEEAPLAPAAAAEQSSLVVPEPKPAPAGVQQLLSMGTEGGAEAAAAAPAVAGPIPGLPLTERDGAISTTPPLEPGEALGVLPAVGPLLEPGFGPVGKAYGVGPPPPGFFFYPMAPVVPSMQFGDVDLCEILQQEQHGRPFPPGAAHFPPPMPFAGMPLPPGVALPPPPPHFAEPMHGFPPLPYLAAPAGAEGPTLPPAQLPEQQAAGEAEAAAPSAPPVEAVAAAAVQPSEPAAAGPGPSDAEAAAAAAAAAGSLHLESMLRAAASAAVLRGLAFDAARAAQELAGRWQAAAAAAPPQAGTHGAQWPVGASLPPQKQQAAPELEAAGAPSFALVVGKQRPKAGRGPVARGWSSSEEAGDGAGRWRISAAK